MTADALFWWSEEENPPKDRIASGIRKRSSFPLRYGRVSKPRALSHGGAAPNIVSFILCFLVPDLYVAIAFDSTGVATGTLSSCFLLPLFIGFTNAYYGKTLTGDALAAKVLENGFGIIGMISTMPIISIELIGLIAKIKNKQAYKKALLRVKEFDDSQVIHLPG